MTKKCENLPSMQRVKFGNFLNLSVACLSIIIGCLVSLNESGFCMPTTVVQTFDTPMIHSIPEIIIRKS